MTPESDGGADDGGAADGGDDDGGEANGHDAGPEGEPSTQIAAVRGTPVGAIAPAAPIEGAIVTYVRSALGDDPAMFFVQGDADGPALAVAMDPSSLDPAPVAGDVVSFRVSETVRLPAAARHWPRRVEPRRSGRGSRRAHPGLVGRGGRGGGRPLRERARDRARDPGGRCRLCRARQQPLAARHVRRGLLRFEPAAAYRAARERGGRRRLRRDGRAQPHVASRAPRSRWRTKLRTSWCTTAPTPRSSPPWWWTPPTWRWSSAGRWTRATAQASDFAFGADALGVTDAVTDGDTVTLTTDEMVSGVVYTVIVTDVSDVHGAAIGSANSADFIGLGSGQASLLLTEYVEGASTDRALEITNRGELRIERSSCGIHLYSNGGTSAVVHPLPAGILAPGESFIVCSATSSPELMAFCDELDTTPVSFNGDDALVLRCGDVVVDSVGQVGVDPGAAWTSGAVSTINDTLRRRCDVGVGDGASTDAFDPAVEWEPAGFGVYRSGGGSRLRVKSAEASTGHFYRTQNRTFLRCSGR